MSKLVPVILCGGSGTRLWPRSRASKPKPFLPLVGETTLFQATLERCPATDGFGAPVVVTGTAHLEHVEEQLGDRPGAEIIVEPCARNTAAAIALAALRLPEDAVMLVCPSDHYIGDAKAFADAACTAADLAQQGWLVSFGIEATAPETGFGYLKRGEAISDQAFRTAQFVEKPDLERAKSFLAEGIYAWNGGIFAFRVGDFLKELEAHRPQILAAVRKAVEGGSSDGHRFHPDAAAFAAVESESVDYAVMENTGRAAMVPADMAWSDIGNWQALHTARDRDELGNATRGPVELVDCRNVLVDSDGPRVSVIGLEDVYVVVDGDDIMITTAAGAQKVGKLSGAVNQ
ncbi:mannose-1-phosphate guanylyltransferase/mannose-1-phosphate guanylyltransferase/mannose-6-phosphate isomerase [Novosphingobium chloroacetimidivorans]|uniref:Mannose-1-phosphate guanylyltransferase/mannose-1-phosphate guanylyltransferase/mannose-6-phosphate isomerase n=1 Tax=Novosphingobium chloroacetimidivorans TaxID=1428314 RepID=A0A7W7NWI8_9SPHN|nr:sugar phosphate nucleotidyltransferase [Novosphingobium chloroacetimidivorans]MBB4858142.1 mannose-1-phosphate guanylyltransferase/mannose-1-phosphate guanylyltransferase/mannose-6-phosphate isomerase [Novosphingobium chloroacetimidivorans]